MKKGHKFWHDVRGQKFSTIEAWEATDIEDILDMSAVEEVDLPEIMSVATKTGERLFLAEMLPVDWLGAVVMAENDNRIINVAKARIEERNQSGSIIFIKG